MTPFYLMISVFSFRGQVYTHIVRVPVARVYWQPFKAEFILN